VLWAVACEEFRGDQIMIRDVACECKGFRSISTVI
jgi:hypothetical protein